MEALKIALIDLNTPIGGGHFALGNLARGLAERNHEIHLVLGVKQLNKRLEDLCGSYCHTHYIKGYRNIYDILKSISRIRKDIFNLCITYDFDILHVQGLNGLFIPSSKLDRLVITLHGNNIYRGLKLINYSLTNLFNIYFTQYLSTVLDDGLGSLGYWILERKSCEKARKIITLSNFEANMARKFYGLSWEKIKVIPNPVTLPNEVSEDKNFIDNEKVVLTIGSHSLMKGTPIIIKASKCLLLKNSDITHIFIGRGPFSNMVIDFASKYKDRVKVIPSVSNEIVSYYRNSSLLLHGSLYESQGLVLGEAMLAGKPVVAFDVASIPEFVVNGVTGYLSEPFDPEDLAGKALCILDDDEKAKKMGLMGKKRALNLFNLQDIAGKVEGVYREVLENGSP